jgi:hypothetical protein
MAKTTTPTTTTTTTTTTPPPKRPWYHDDFVNTFRKKFKKFKMRIHVSDGAYNDEQIAEFVFKARHVCDEYGRVMVDFRKELEIFMEEIGRRGYTDKNEDGLTYYPPHRIHYIEVVDTKDDDKD